MKLDIKSFIIGVLTTVNLFLLMGFDDHEEENKYDIERIGGNIVWFDKRTGEFVGNYSDSTERYRVPNSGGMNVSSKYYTESQFIDYLKERD